MAENRSILLVEDNPMDLDLTLRAFARRKITNKIEVARDGQEALDFIGAWEAGAEVPLVILLDVHLPKVDGLEVLRCLRAHARFGTIPVVMLTTSAEMEDIRQAYALGANSYIVKPVDFDKFVDVAAQIDLYWTVLNRPLSVPS
ncbi:MAG: response regulator [Bacteriovorax sp.]|nr:response regulator [Rhizobacter sp.]